MEPVKAETTNIDPDNDSPETKRNPIRKMAKTIAIKVIVPIINDRVKDITPNQCYEGIISNTSIWGKTPIDLKGKALELAQRFSFLYFKFEDSITAEMLIENWMKIDRPDLYEIVDGVRIDNEPTGHIWFKEQVKTFKQEFRKLLGKT
jgi:hypothetical protein